MKRRVNFYGILAAAFLLFWPVLVAAVEITPLPSPRPSEKLRVFVVVITSEHKSTGRPVVWLVSPEKLEWEMKKVINVKLKELGFYEVVGEKDVQAVLKGQTIPNWQWKKGDWALAADVGRALHADYTIVFDRKMGIDLSYDAKLINLRSRRQFEASGYVATAASSYRMLTPEQKIRAGQEATGILLRSLFQESKSDLIQTAILKGRKAVPEKAPDAILPSPGREPQPGAISKSIVVATPLEKSIPEPAPRNKEVKTAVVADDPQDKPSVPTASKNVQKPDTTIIPAVKPVFSEDRTRDKAGRKLAFDKELEKALSAGNKSSDHPRLVVYDFDADERMKVVGLILTEALREEIYHLGGFILVNRESILKIMDEYKLQQTALVDEKQVVAVGRWLAANEAITGQLGALGNTSILQVKRVDIRTMGTLSLGSLKCSAGREDELLDKMPDLAKKLVSPK